MAEVYLSYHRERGEVHLNRPSVFHNRWKTTFSSLHHRVFRRILTSVSWDCERAQNSSERPLLTFDIWTQSLLAAWKEWQFQGLILHFVYLVLHLQSSCINTLTWSVSYQPSNLSFVSWFNQWHKSLTHYDLNWFSPCYCQVWSLLFLGKINQPKHTQLNATFFVNYPVRPYGFWWNGVYELWHTALWLAHWLSQGLFRAIFLQRPCCMCQTLSKACCSYHFW